MANYYPDGEPMSPSIESLTRGAAMSTYPEFLNVRGEYLESLEARLQAAVQVVEAAVVLAEYWPGKRVRGHYSENMIRFLEAVDEYQAVWGRAQQP